MQTGERKDAKSLVLRPGSHGCKIWLFVREALQFPWLLQQNLEAAARSAEKREAARRAASHASHAAAAEKKRRLQRLECEKECEVEVVKFRFLFFFCFWKDNFFGVWWPFRVVLHFFFIFCCRRKTVTLRLEVWRAASRAATAEKKALAAVFAIWEGMRGHAVAVVLFFSFPFLFFFLEKRTFSRRKTFSISAACFFF